MNPKSKVQSPKLKLEFKLQPCRKQSKARAARAIRHRRTGVVDFSFQKIVHAGTLPAWHQRSKSPSSAPARWDRTTSAFTPNSPPPDRWNSPASYDTSADTARKIAAKHNARVFNSVAEAAAASDALNIVTPTTTHFELAKSLLQQGKHVLVEKPMTDNAAQAAELVQLAQQKNCVLQVGHVERFNPVFKYLETVATEPRFIETPPPVALPCPLAPTSAWCST